MTDAVNHDGADESNFILDQYCRTIDTGNTVGVDCSASSMFKRNRKYGNETRVRKETQREWNVSKCQNRWAYESECKIISYKVGWCTLTDNCTMQKLKWSDVPHVLPLKFKQYFSLPLLNSCLAGILYCQKIFLRNILCLLGLEFELEVNVSLCLVSIRTFRIMHNLFFLMVENHGIRPIKQSAWWLQIATFTLLQGFVCACKG